MYPGVGIVHLTVRRNSTSISARWRDGKVYLVVPPWTSAPDVYKALDEFAPELMRLRPDSACYSPGMELRYDDAIVRISDYPGGRGEVRSRLDHVPADGGPYRFTIFVDFNGIVNADAVAVSVDKMLRGIGRYITQVRVIDRARRVADALGITVRGWSVGHGRSRMGSCSQSGHIKLSQVNGLRSHDEQLNTITHELAHLRHFDHSEAFHSYHAQLLQRARVLGL